MSIVRKVQANKPHRIVQLKDVEGVVYLEFKVERVPLAAQLGAAQKIPSLRATLSAFRTRGGEAPSGDEVEAMIERGPELAQALVDSVEILLRSVRWCREPAGDWQAVTWGSEAHDGPPLMLCADDFPVSFIGDVRAAVDALEGRGVDPHPTVSLAI